MHVWLIKLEELLPVDNDYRPYRMGMLATSLLARGHTVTRWASDYNHYNHKYRFGKNSRIKLDDNYYAMLLYSGVAYSSAVSWKRLLDNYLLSREYNKEARKQESPDIIVCSMPTPELAAVSAELASYFDVPLVVDARDMWPDVIESEMHGAMSLLSKPAIFWMKQNLRKATQRADSLIGITPFYRDFLLKYAERKKTPLDGVFPLGYDPQAAAYNATEEKELFDFWLSKGVDLEQSHIVYFAGRLNSTIYNTIEHTISAIDELQKRRLDFQFVYCGSGVYEEKIRNKTQSLKNITFPGEVGTKALAILRKHAFVALLPVERRVDFQNSLSNKFFEYLSSGMVVLSWLDGMPGKVLENNQCGYIYNSGAELANYLEELLRNPQKKAEMGRRALELFKKDYAANNVYKNFAIFLEQIKNG